jgi:hypothetical protein
LPKYFTQKTILLQFHIWYLCNQVFKNLKRSAKLERFSRFTKSVYLQEGAILVGQVVGAKKQVAFQYLKKQVGKNILKVVSMKMMTTKRYG